MSGFFSIHCTIIGMKNGVCLYRGVRYIGVRYIGDLLHTFYYYWAQQYRSLYRGLLYVGPHQLYRGSLLHI